MKNSTRNLVKEEEEEEANRIVVLGSNVEFYVYVFVLCLYL